MLFTGRVLCANEALRYGLVSRVIHSNDDDDDSLSEDDQHGGGDARVKEEANAIARLIASKSAHAVQMGKETLYEQVESATMEEAYGIASSAMVRGIESEDAIHGIESFLKKERPIWNQKHR
jgi:enoyl-CoA hydratase/carnithine racemase